MQMFNLNFDRETHLTVLCDWCGLPKGPGHVCPVDEPPPDEADEYDLDDDELLLEDGEGA